jgi:hypothetical protein
MRLRYDWRALRSLYVQGDDELTLDTLAAGAGLDADRTEKRAKAEDWEFMQARYRVRMGIPQKTDILDRCRDEWDAQCKAAFVKLDALKQREKEQEVIRGSHSRKTKQS